MTLLVRHATQVAQSNNPDREVSADAWHANHSISRGSADLATPLVNRVRDRINVLDYAASSAIRSSIAAGSTAVDSVWTDAIADAAAQSASEIFVPAGSFHTGDGSVLLNSGFMVRGEGARTVFYKNGLDQLFSTQQAAPTISGGALAADAGVGTSYLNSCLLSTGLGAGFTVGQQCLLVSEGAISASASDKKAQFVTVQAISGDTVSFWETLIYSFATSDTARLVPITLATGVGYRDLEIVMDDTITLESSLTYNPNFALDVQFAKDVRIDNVGISGAVSSMISLRGVKGALLSNIRGYDGGSSTTGTDDPESTEGAGGYSYGVALTGLNHGVVVNGGHFERIRHAVTTLGFYSSIFNYGEPVSGVFSAITALGMKNSAFDTHQAGRDINFIGCAAAHGRFAGFQVRSQETRLRGCSARDMIGPAVWVRGGAGSQLAGDRCQVTDFTAERTNLGTSLGFDWTLYGAVLDEGNDTLIAGLRAVETAGPALTVGRNGVARRSIYRDIDATDVCQNTTNSAVVHIIDSASSQDVFVSDLKSISTDGNVEDLIRIDSSDPVVHLTDVFGIGQSGRRVRTVAPDKVDDFDAPINRYRKRMSDEFIGYTISSQWRTHKGTDGSAAYPVIFAAEESKCRLATGADAAGDMAANGSQLSGNLNWRASLGTLVGRFRILTSAITNVCLFFGFTDQISVLEMPFTLGGSDALTSNAADAVGVLFDTGADTDNWWLVGVKADTDATHQNVGAAPVAATYEDWEIRIDTAGTAKFYRNGLQVGTAMADAVTTSVLLAPVVAAFSRSTVSRNVDLDFIYVEQPR